MTTYRITTKQKRSWRPRLIRYYGRVCFYCKNPFLVQAHTMNAMKDPLLEEFDHLNDKEYDNRIENIVLSHKMCNSKKRFDDSMKQMALEQLRENEIKGIPGHEEEIDNEEELSRQNNEEIYSNTEFMKITTEYLEESLKTTDKIPYASTVNNIAMKAFNLIGHGSPTTIRKCVDMLTSDEGNYYKYREGGKRWITKNNPLFSK